MLGLKKFFVPDPVDASKRPGQSASAGASASSSKAATAQAEAGRDRPDVVATAEQIEAAAPKTFVDWVDWNALGTAAATAVEDAHGFDPQKEYNETGLFGPDYFNYRTGKWDDGNDPEGSYDPYPG